MEKLEPCPWLENLERFADRIDRAVPPLLKIAGAFEIVFLRAVVFAGFLGFLYEQYLHAHGH